MLALMHARAVLPSPSQGRAVVAPARSPRSRLLRHAPRRSERQAVKCYVSVAEAPAASLRLLQRVKLHQAAVTRIFVLKDGAGERRRRPAHAHLRCSPRPRPPGPRG